jgi:uncharacterized alpha-E superfamily protein
MAKTTYDDTQRQQALDAYQEHGPAEAERRTGIPRKTIASWARRSGTQMDATAPARLQLAAEIAALNADQKRARLASAMWDKLADALERLGPNALANAQESRLIAVLAEKAQLLSGGATSRDQLDVSTPQARLALVQDLTSKRPAAPVEEAG